MHFGVAALLVLLGAWIAVRRGATNAVPEAREAPPAWQWVAGIGVVLAANFPLALVTWPFSGFPPLAPSDAHSHALIAQSIAMHGLPHGWIEAYQGGFPFGPHYPSIGWLLIAAAIKLGASAPGAALAIGTICLLAAPVVAFAAAFRAGARWLPSLLGALCLTWLSPANGFVGGYETYWGKGLMSQLAALPFVILLVSVVASRAPRWLLAVASSLAVACHPQVTVACFACLLLPVLASLDRGALARYAFAAFTAGCLGAALYGPGIMNLQVPFGWPPMDPWLVTGYAPVRLRYWLVDGDLLDLDRGPVLTTLWFASLLIAALRARRPMMRAVLVGSVATVALSVSGGALDSAGPLRLVLGFLQPMRVISLVPLAMAASIVVAANEVLEVFRGPWPELRARSWLPAPGRLSAALQAVLVVGFAVVAMPERFAFARDVRATAQTSTRSSALCGPGRYDETIIKSRLRELGVGRLWYDDGIDGGMGICAFVSGFEFASAAPIAVARGAGAHVGVHTAVFHELHPERTGWSARAEALGVRYLLMKSDAAVADPEEWTAIASTQGSRLLERKGGTDTIGVGCVESSWEGSNAALQARIQDEIQSEQGAARLLSRSLVELKTSAGEVRETHVDAGGCDSRGATVRETRREPGAFEAEVATPAEVDVVIKAAAFRTWKVQVDGEATPVRKVIPGFFAVRVGPGSHRVVAVVSPLRGYTAGIVIALSVIAAACVRGRDWQKLLRRRGAGSRGHM